MTGCFIPITCEGCSKEPHIGDNGNWFIGDTDMGVKAQGPQGETGPKGDTGAQGPKGDTGAQGPQGIPGYLTGYKLLFEGKANTVNTNYSLLGHVTDYKFLIVEYTIYRMDGQEVVFYDWVPFPRVSSTQYLGRLLNAGVLNHEDNNVYIYYKIKTSDSIGVEMVECNNSIFKDVAITKIYGLD